MAYVVTMKQLQFYKERIKQALSTIREDVGELRYSLYLSMVDQCDDYDELKDMAELEMQLDFIKYTRDSVYSKLKEKEVDIKDLRSIYDPNLHEVPRPIEESELEEDLDSPALVTAIANALYRRLQNTPIEEQNLEFIPGCRIGQDEPIVPTEEEFLDMLKNQLEADEALVTELYAEYEDEEESLFEDTDDDDEGYTEDEDEDEDEESTPIGGSSKIDPSDTEDSLFVDDGDDDDVDDTVKSLFDENEEPELLFDESDEELDGADIFISDDEDSDELFEDDSEDDDIIAGSVFIEDSETDIEIDIDEDELGLDEDEEDSADLEIDIDEDELGVGDDEGGEDEDTEIEIDINEEELGLDDDYYQSGPETPYKPKPVAIAKPAPKPVTSSTVFTDQRTQKLFSILYKGSQSATKGATTAAKKVADVAKKTAANDFFTLDTDRSNRVK